MASFPYNADEIYQQVKLMHVEAKATRGESIGFPGYYDYSEGWECALNAVLEMIENLKAENDG